MIHSSVETTWMHHHPVLLFRLRYTILEGNFGKGIEILKCFGIIINIILVMVYTAREVYPVYGEELGKSRK